MNQVEDSLFTRKETCDTLNPEMALVDIETARRFADHYLALAQYWRKVARMPPVPTEASQRKMMASLR